MSQNTGVLALKDAKGVTVWAVAAPNGPSSEDLPTTGCFGPGPFPDPSVPLTLPDDVVLPWQVGVKHDVWWNDNVRGVVYDEDGHRLDSVVAQNGLIYSSS